MLARCLVGVLWMLPAAVWAQDCISPCAIDDGDYHIALPDADTPPAVLWLHGFGGSGARAVANEGFASRFTDRGYALIAPDGLPYPSSEKHTDWGVADGADDPRDDVVFLQGVLSDAITRHSLDGDRILVAGFSRGGSMVWDLACAAPDTALGFAAVAGGFWEPMTPDCTAPVHLHHTHGLMDKTVPFEGRKVAFQGVDYHQGNIMKGIEVWRTINGCPGAADSRQVEAQPWSIRWTDCTDGSLTLQITTGGHGIPRGWTASVLDWFEALSPA